MIVIQDNRLTAGTVRARRRTAHCFFEWIYFAIWPASLDDRSVYLSRAPPGRRIGPAGANSGPRAAG